MGTSIFAKQRNFSLTAVCLILILAACNFVPERTAVPAPTASATDLPSPSATFAPTATPLPSATPTPDQPGTATAIARDCAAVPAGLVGWWAGNGDPRDVVAGNDGVIRDWADFAPGKVGQAFRFIGLKGSVDVPQTPSLNLKQVSVEFWMQPHSTNEMNTCCQGLVSTDFCLMEISGGRSPIPGVNWVVNTGGGYHHTSDKNESAFQAPPGEWSFIVGTYDGQFLRLYVNGKEEVELGHPGNIAPMYPASFLTIGSEDGRRDCPGCIGTRYFTGLIDEVSIYNRALAAEEIQSIFLAGEAGKCMPP